MDYVMDGTCSIEEPTTVLQPDNLKGSVGGGRIILKLIICK
jgi:hypothetical protein